MIRSQIYQYPLISKAIDKTYWKRILNAKTKLEMNIECNNTISDPKGQRCKIKSSQK